MRILISFCKELEVLVGRVLQRDGHAVIYPHRSFGNSWYSQRDAVKPNIIFTDDPDKYGRYDEECVPVLKVTGIDQLAAAVALGKSILRHNRHVGHSDVTFFATEFQCYRDGSQGSCKEQPVHRNDVAQELAVFAMLVNEASVRLDRAKDYLEYVENNFDEDLEDLMYRLSTGSWKVFHLRVWVMHLCAFFAHFIPGVDVEHFPLFGKLKYMSRFIYWDLPFAMTYPAHCLMEGQLDPFVCSGLQETLAFSHVKAASRRGVILEAQCLLGFLTYLLKAAHDTRSAFTKIGALFSERAAMVNFESSYAIKGLDTMLRFWNLQKLVNNKAVYDLIEELAKGRTSIRRHGKSSDSPLSYASLEQRVKQRSLSSPP
jgi:hypothetical protein